MRILRCLLGCLALCLFGCATPRQVAEMEGKGKAQVYNANFDQTWRAAVDAAQIGELRVRNADRQRGYIAAGRGMQIETHGENVGIWVREVAPGQTRVEVVNRQAGPPKFWFKNWEDEILDSISANLTREMGRGSWSPNDPAGAELYQQQSTIYESTPVSPPPPVNGDVY